MHNNYYLFRQLVPALEKKIKGHPFIACFSQQKDEMILRFAQEHEASFFIKASLQPSFSCLSFPETFHRTKKHSIDLFTTALGKQVIGCRQFLNERCFAILLEDDFSLLFKMHGNRSNLLLYKGEKVIDIFRHNFPADQEVTFSDWDRPIQQDFAAFEAAGGNYQNLFPTLGKIPKQYLREKAYDKKPLEVQWEMLQQLVQKLENPAAFFILKQNKGFVFSLLKLEADEVVEEGKDPLQMLTQFFSLAIRNWQFSKSYQQIEKDLLKQQKQSQNYLSKTRQKLKDIETATPYDQLADILMANLHQIKPHQTEATLFNFYTNEEITIPIKRDYTPQKQAEVFYKKARNKKKEIAQLESALKNKEKALESLRAKLEQLQQAEEIKDLKPLMKEKENVSPQQQNLPYKRFEADGFTFLVGKSARDNDKLLQQHGYKEDLWFHAKDVTGSHVLLKYRSDKAFTPEVKEKAAILAAFYSKRKNDTLCPVIMTPRKYIRKSKQLAPGQVMVDREEVLLVPVEPWW